MGYQFIHVEEYGRVAGKGKEGGSSMSDIVAEAERKPDACEHIENPVPPKILYGTAPSGALVEAESWAEQAKDKKGRKLRKDGHCVLVGVVSLPTSESFKWEKFKISATKWLKWKYGDRLKSVIEHTDEAHPHLHFFVVPRQGERFETVHDGQLAANAVKDEGKLKGDQNRAYIGAMKAYQDRFGLDVASRYGLTRLGPKRRRLTRKEWKIEQQNAEYNAKLNTRAKKYEENGFKKGQKAGFEYGQATAVAEQQKLSKKLGNLWGGMVAGWNQPVNDAKKEAEEEKKKRLEAEDKLKKVKKLAREEVNDEFENELDMLRSQIQKKDRIIENQEKDIEHINKELASYGATYRINPEKHRKNAV
ncbi:plasmid recombination protein [Burkholderia gladioli]|uniref:plasmid recombination protein n=1 Tax=Burkholderia gladioli TaxID=28095 RepID=UPI003AFAD5CB